MFNVFRKTFTLLLEVASWLVGTLFVNDVVAYVTTSDGTVGLFDLAFTFFVVAVFFLVRLLSEEVLARKEREKLLKAENLKRTAKKLKKEARKAKKTRKVVHKK